MVLPDLTRINDKIREMRVLKTQHTEEAKSFETVEERRKEQRMIF